MKRFVASLLAVSLLVSALSLNVFAATKKEPVLKTKTMSGVIKEVNVSGKYILIPEGKKKTKKIMVDTAVIVGVAETGARVLGLSELAVNKKAQFILKSKKNSNKEYVALVVYQSISAEMATAAGVQFSTTGVAGAENITSASLQVTLSKPATQEVKVNYTVAGSATGAGVDYTLANGEVTIPVGQTAATIPLTVVDDSTAEADETVVVTLASATNASLGTNKVLTYTIQDNDQPRVQFSTTSSAGLESVALVNLQVSLSAAVTQEVRVNYTVAGSATGSGTDYTLSNGQVTIAVGQTSANIPIVVNDDTTLEGDETVVVTLASPTGSILGTNTVHTYTIQDNDQPE